MKSLPKALVDARLVSSLLALALQVTAASSYAGIYGNENWGEMYWGSNPVTAPIAAPTILSATAAGDEIIITLSDFPQGTGADGWSAITSYTVTCGETTVATTGTTVGISGLDFETEYSCSVSANNAQGSSPSQVTIVATGAELQGFNFRLLCAIGRCG